MEYEERCDTPRQIHVETRVLVIKPWVVVKLASIDAWTFDVMNRIVKKVTDGEAPFSMRDGLLYFRGNHVQFDTTITMWTTTGHLPTLGWYAGDQDETILVKRNSNVMRYKWKD
jgi:hypothetical protein